MGTATASALLGHGLPPANITISTPHPHKIDCFAQKGCTVTSDNNQAVQGASVIVLAVKPWILPEVVAQLKPSLNYKEQAVAVIAASVTAHQLSGMFSTPSSQLPRWLAIAMPNTAAALGQSMTFIVPVNGPATQALEIFGTTGQAMEITEKLLAPAMALASCGIAYVLRYVHAAMQAGVEMGMKPHDAQIALAQTLRGAAALLEQQGAHPETEIDKVTTPGGVTIKGLNALEKAGFTNAVIQGITASKA